MSDPSISRSSVSQTVAARPVSLLTIIAVFLLLGVVVLVGRQLYSPSAVTVQNAAAEHLPKELEWRATAETRRKALTELKEAQTQKEHSYAWIDRNAGVVQLPIERAMELTAGQYGKKQ